MSRSLTLSLFAGIFFSAIVTSSAFATTPTPTAHATPAPPCSFSLCSADAMTGCKQDFEPGRSSLLLHDVTPDKGDRLVWKWLKGTSTAKGEFGDPRSTTDYELCVYDGNGLLVSRACAPHEGDCAGRPCWKEINNGFRYRKRDLSPLRSSFGIVLKAGADGKGKIVVKGHGPVFVMPDMPMRMPITAQLLNTEGVCWDTVFFPPAQTNRVGDFHDHDGE